MSETEDIVRKAVDAERIRIIAAIFAKAEEISAASPFPRWSGEPVAVAIEHIASGCRRAAEVVMPAKRANHPAPIVEERIPEGLEK